jgi:hypothetical protein
MPAAESWLKLEVEKIDVALVELESDSASLAVYLRAIRSTQQLNVEGVHAQERIALYLGSTAELIEKSIGRISEAVDTCKGLREGLVESNQLLRT